MTQGERQRTLHELVGVSPDASPERLRYAYEQAMARATASLDFQRANVLSRAFDALGTTDRRQVYDRPAGLAYSGPPAPSRRSRRRGTAKRAGRRLGRAVVVTFRYACYLLCIGGLAAGVWYVVQSRRAAPPAPTPRPAAPAGVPTAAVAPPSVGSAPGPSVIVPTNAPTGANGLATVVCQPAAPGQPSYYLTVPRGALVACPNGAVPYVLR